MCHSKLLALFFCRFRWTLLLEWRILNESQIIRKRRKNHPNKVYVYNKRAVQLKDRERWTILYTFKIPWKILVFIHHWPLNDTFFPFMSSAFLLAIRVIFWRFFLIYLLAKSKPKKTKWQIWLSPRQIPQKCLFMSTFRFELWFFHSIVSGLKIPQKMANAIFDVLDYSVFLLNLWYLLFKRPQDE